jgi:hypothetical protein
MNQPCRQPESDPERLREALLDLDRARAHEQEARLVSEQMVACLRLFTSHHTADVLMPALLGTLRTALGFSDALVLFPDQGSGLVASFATGHHLVGSRWRGDGLFFRVNPSRPVALFDIAFVPEWRDQPAEVRDEVRSALHIALREPPDPAYLVCCHPQVGFFGRRHLHLASLFGPLTAHALDDLDLRREVERLRAAASP